MAEPDTTQIDRASALAALRWWVDAGVDVIAADAPRSWLSTAREVASAPSVRIVRDAPKVFERDPTPRLGSSGEQSGRADAATTARAAETPAALLAAAIGYAGPSALLYGGVPESGLLFVIDAPSHEDIRNHRLLTGDPGQLFDRMLAAVGLDRDRVGLATMALQVGGAAGEIAFLHRLIVLTRPHAIVALGGIAATRLTSDTRGLNRLRGRQLKTSIEDVMFQAVCTFHPSHLIANPHHKAMAWADLLALNARVA